MKGFLGLLQIGLGIAGLVALFNGQWLAMIGAWGVAALIGFAGSRLVRRAEGVSEAGRQWGVGDMERGVELLLKGDYTSASRETASAVKTFRMGGDFGLIIMALTAHAVALAARHDLDGARTALVEASDRYQKLPVYQAEMAPGLSQLHSTLQRELAHGVPDPSGLVSEFSRFLNSLPDD